MDDDLDRTPVESAESTVAAPRRRSWLSYRLRSLAILVTICAAILAVYAGQIREYWIGPTEPYETIQTVHDLRAALSGERAVIFVHVDWSTDSIQGRIVFHDFAVEWRRRMPKKPVKFYLLDLTERNPALNEVLAVWCLSRTQGEGELVWIGNATPRAYRFPAAELTHAELASTSQQAFQLSSIAHFPGNPPPAPEDSGLWFWDEPDSLPEPFSTPGNLEVSSMDP